MGRTKATSSKGKEVASSSTPSKRQRTAEQESDSDFDMEDMNMYDDDDDIMVGDQPQWTENVPLSSFDPIWQPTLYKQKKQTVSSIKKVLVCERAVQTEEFGIFGVVSCFENLGWENVLKFNNNNLDNIYMKEIVEWMATLRKEDGNNPPRTTRLIGTVNGKEMVLSFETMNKVVKFDTKPQREYVYPERMQILGEATEDEEWRAMVRVLFAKAPEEMGRKLLRSDLNVLPKLLSLISGFNVIPRLGDKLFIRNFEVRVLHALMIGHPKLSFRQLVLLNVWESRVSRARCLLPHCRLLSSLMVKQKVVTTTTPFEKLTQRYFSFDRLAAFGWIYRERPTEHVLIDDKTKRQLVVLKEGVTQAEEEDTEHMVRPHTSSPFYKGDPRDSQGGPKMRGRAGTG
ncbi:hypothetical protein R6Q57_018002 [Mikania cordata]